MANQVNTWWGRLHSKPAGKFLFSKIIHFMIPYTGSVRPRVVSIAPGHAVVRMADRHKVRNHLNSVHAIALMNLGEFCTGLALTALLDEQSRYILTDLRITFGKKARGPITAECRIEDMDPTVPGAHELEAVLRNRDGEEVSRAWATWKVGPR